MDDMRAQMNRPLVVGIVAFLIGLAIGWFVIGWGLWPVEYTGAGIVDLRLEEKVKHLRLGIDAYGFNRNPDQARQVFADLGADAEQALIDVTTNPAGQDPELVRDFAAVVQAGPVATLTPGAPGEAGVVETPAAAEEEGGSIWNTLLTGLCVIVLLVAAAAIVYLVIRSRSGPQLTEEMSPAQEAQKMARDAERTDYKARGEEAPMTQFMTSYKLGDDLFDDSFSIDSPGGEFLGECGVGIADTIGIGDTKKVSAFEVWLFDKNDIQTVTKVFMSPHALRDEAIRQRLQAKGEFVPASSGAETTLETETLRMVARVVDMEFGHGALPDESFFDRFIIELNIWQKPATAAL